MLPFWGYNMGASFGRGPEEGRATDVDKLPRIDYVRWFRKDAAGRYIWPVFRENSRVLGLMRRDAVTDLTPAGTVTRTKGGKPGIPDTWTLTTSHETGAGHGPDHLPSANSQPGDDPATGDQDGPGEDETAGGAAQLTDAAATAVSRFADVAPGQWLRKGRRSDGAQFTVETFGRNLAHEAVHHLYDVTGIRYGDPHYP